MTVGELKVALANLPDETPVVVHDPKVETADQLSKRSDVRTFFRYPDDGEVKALVLTFDPEEEDGTLAVFRGWWTL